MPSTSVTTGRPATRSLDVYAALDEPSVRGPDAPRTDPPDLGPMMQALGHVTTMTADPSRPRAALDALVRAAAVWVPGCESACLVVVGASVGHGRRVQVTAATDPLADEVADLAGATDEATWAAAARGLDVIRIDDVRCGATVPDLASAFVASLVRSLLAVRLPLGVRANRRAGTLVLVSRQPCAFTDRSEEIAQLFATYALLAVSSTLEVENLQTALASRDVIGTAKGVVMARYGLDVDRAFALLVRVSRNNNLKLRDVAERLVRNEPVPDLDTTG